MKTNVADLNIPQFFIPTFNFHTLVKNDYNNISK